MILALEIVGLVFMFSIIFLSVWGFILINKLFLQIKYKNYLLEKISDELSILNKRAK
jgi:hypothetical protein